MKGNKTAWEDEADESGLSSIRKNHAPVYGPTGGEFSSPSSEAFNRGGFRGFGEVGTQSLLPNGEYISYKDIDLPHGLTNLLGIGGGKGKTADGESIPEGQFEGYNYETFVGPPHQLKRGDPGYWKKAQPGTKNFWNGGPGQWLDEVGGAVKGMLAPATIPFEFIKQLRQTVDPNSPDFNPAIAAKARDLLGDKFTDFVGGRGGSTTMSLLGPLLGTLGR